MALKMEFVNEQGFTCEKENSYLKITNLNGDKGIMFIELTYFRVLNSEMFANFSKRFSFTPALEVGCDNFICQAYCYLKTLPEFFTAEDC